MLIIFLDYDGVLCNMATKIHHADPVCVKHLNTITATTGAKIVVSSTWRRDGLKKNRERLAAWGVTGKVLAVTPDLSTQTRSGLHKSVDRGIEIGYWLAYGSGSWRIQPWPIDSFVILDDDRDMGNLLPHLVRTDSRAGLTESDALKAIKHLGIVQIPIPFSQDMSRGRK